MSQNDLPWIRLIRCSHEEPDPGKPQSGIHWAGQMLQPQLTKGSHLCTLHHCRWCWDCREFGSWHISRILGTWVRSTSPKNCISMPGLIQSMINLVGKKWMAHHEKCPIFCLTWTMNYTQKASKSHLKWLHQAPPFTHTLELMINRSDTAGPRWGAKLWCWRNQPFSSCSNWWFEKCWRKTMFNKPT